MPQEKPKQEEQKQEEGTALAVPFALSDIQPGEVTEEMKRIILLEMTDDERKQAVYLFLPTIRIMGNVENICMRFMGMMRYGRNQKKAFCLMKAGVTVFICFGHRKIPCMKGTGPGRTYAKVSKT